MLSRLTDDWQSAQPAHLRHLGLIRDTGTQARFTYYKYRTYDGFQQAVDSGETNWEIVRAADNQGDPPPPVFDEWGFPPIAKDELVSDGTATLAKCLAEKKIPAEVLTSYDPVLVRNGEDDEVSVVLPKGLTKNKGPQSSIRVRKKMAVTPSSSRKRGRPKKNPEAATDEVMARSQAPRPRGRPKKNPEAAIENVVSEPQASRARGRPKKIADASMVKPDLKAGAEKIKQDNADYRMKKRLEKEAAERELQIRHQAEETAYEETLAKQKTNGTVTVLPESLSHGKYETVFKAETDRCKLVIVDELPQEPYPPPKRSRGRPKKGQQASESVEQSNNNGSIPDETGIGSSDPTRKGKPCVIVLESRVQELVTFFSDTTRHAVHINPPGSKPSVPLTRGKRLIQLVVVFKFPWLRDLDWFVAPPPPLSPPAPESVEIEDDAEPEAVTATESIIVASTSLEADEAPVAQPGANRIRKRSLPEKSIAAPKRPRMEQNHVPPSPASQARFFEQREVDVDMADVPSVVEIENGDPPREDSDTAYSEQIETVQNYDDWKLRNSNYKKPEMPPHRPFRKKKGIALGGGSVQFKRTLLIIEIVEKCGGAFPADGEIVPIYQRLQKTANSSTTDRDTILKAVRSCVDTGKLKRVAYAISSNGVAVTRNILLLPDMTINSPVALSIMKGVEEMYPRTFHPAEVAETPKKQAKNISRFLHQDPGVPTSLDPTGWAESFRNKQKELETKRAANLEKGRKQRAKYQLTKANRSAQDGLEPSQKLVSLKARTREQRQALDQLPDRQVPDWSAWLEVQDQTTAEQETPGEEITMVELLSNLGSFAPAYNPTRDDEYLYGDGENDGDNDILPSIEVDKQTFRRSGRQPDPHDFWIIEDPAASSGRRLTSSRRGSVYSISDTETDEEHERRMRSDSTDNAIRSSQHIINLEDPSPTRHCRTNPETNLDGHPQTHLESLTGTLKPTIYHHYIAPGQEESRSKGRSRRKGLSRNMLIHNQLTFKTVGPQNYNPWYEWEDVGTLLDPDQRFHPSTGTFSTDFFVRRNTRASKWVPPTTAVMFENMSSTSKRDVDTLLDIDDWDSHYHPDGPKRRHRTLRHRHVDSDDDQGDVIDSTRAEKEEIRIMKKNFPGINIGKNQGGFINYSFGHGQETAAQVHGEYNYHAGDRVVIYGTSNQALPQYIRQALPPQPRGIRIVPGGYGYARTPGGGVQGFQPGAAAAESGTKTTRPMKQNPNCVIEPDAARRLLFAVIAVRTLAGGLDSAIRWPYINTIFASHPNYDLLTFKARWQRMFNNHKELIARVTRDFQDTFILAYHRNELPKFNTNDMVNYDWNYLVNWAVRTITIFPDEIILPPDGEALNRSFNVVTTIRTKNDDLKSKMEHLHATNTQRINETHNLDVYVPVVLRPRPKPSKADEDLVVARSWARACSATDSAIFDSMAANVKLRTIDDKLVAEAIRQLHEEKVIAHSFRGRHKPGRNFHLGDGYQALFTKRPLELQHFAEAMEFKHLLDRAKASKEEPLLVKYDASDGQYLVIIELMANGRIKVVPQLPPINSTIGDPWPRLSVWGFMEGHYRGRDTDKKVFMWNVALEKTDNYISGLPFEQHLKDIPPPTNPGTDETGKQRLPIWRDIHGNLREEQWRKLIFCVIQHIAVRGGSGIDALRVQFKGLIWAWEMELLVNWLIDVGVARWTSDIADAGAGKGVIAKEWWWTIVPDSSADTNGQDGGETERTGEEAETAAGAGADLVMAEGAHGDN
jgi:hypothetical protein